MDTRLVQRILIGAGWFFLTSAGVGSEAGRAAGKVDLDFSEGVGVAGWTPLNDTVMGGQSTSQFEPIEGAMRFSGSLSQDNRGGFASVRGELPLSGLGETEGFELRIRGDGREYSLMIWTDDTVDRVYYGASFAPEAGVWQTVSLRWSDFKPYFRGFWVAQKDLDPNRIISIGLMISDGKAGPFALEIEWLRSITREQMPSGDGLRTPVT